MFTCTTHSGRIAFAYYIQFFPKAQTLVLEHLHKAIESSIIIDHAIAHASLVLLFMSLMLLLGNDHLPLGKIANHHSPFSESVCDKMGGFVQTVLLFVALAFRHPLIHSGETNVAARLLLALIAFCVSL